ncbi:BatD family protein, partial [Pseudomonas aeruginosa]|uniref:BatD family protein n=1 Tax=Pseudomonas aeruginosa TaxID=287 RepID=UPI003F8DA69B
GLARRAAATAEAGCRKAPRPSAARCACLANDPQATRQALDAWARQQPDTLADMAARFVPLSDALDGLNGALYSESGHSWQGEDLWRAIRALPTTEQAPAGAVDNGGLPPLYPR